MDHVDDLERRIACFRAKLLAGLAPQQGLLNALQTIPGLDELGAALLLVEIGDDMQAFGTPEKLASWAGVCPGNHESAGKRQNGKQRKGNPYVRRLLCEAAQAASRTRCALQRGPPRWSASTASAAGRRWPDGVAHPRDLVPAAGRVKAQPT